MKIPIEFVNASDSKFQTLLDDSAEFSNFRRLNVDLEVAKSQNDTATTLLALTSGLIRTASAYDEILKFEESFKKTVVEINNDVIVREYKLFEDFNVSALQTEIGLLEGLKDELIGKIDGLFSLVFSLEYTVNSQLKMAIEYSDDLTALLDEFNLLIARLKAVDLSRPRSEISSILKTSINLHTIMKERLAQLLPELMTETAFNRAIDAEDYLFAIDSYLNILESEYDSLRRRFEIYEREFRFLLDESKRLYANILNGAYVRSGDWVVVSKHETDGFMRVSASKPKMTECKTWPAEYIPPDITVRQLTTVCPPPRQTTKSSGGGGGGGENTTSTPTTTSSGNSGIEKIEKLSDLKNCGIPDYAYWTKEQSTDHFVSDLVNNGKPLDPKNAQHVAAADDFYSKNFKFKVAGITNFYYCISAVAARAGYPNLIIGTMNVDVGTYHKSVSNFYHCLYVLFRTSLVENSLAPHFESFSKFKSDAKSAGLSYSDRELLSFYFTYRWKTISDVGAAFNNLAGNMSLVEEVVNSLKAEDHACQRFSFHEALAQSSVMGYAMQANANNVRIVNLEPESATFSPAGQTQMMFKGGQWRPLSFKQTTQGQAIASIAFYAAERPGKDDPTKKDGISATAAISLMYTAIHEAAHSVDYVKGRDLGQNFGFSTSTAWLNIAGWKKNSNGYYLNGSFKYPSELSASDPEPPVTTYGCTYPWEDFAEAWTMYVLAPAVLENWYPKRFKFMQTHVVPYMKDVRR